MSQENVEIARAFLEAFDRGDLDEASGFLAADIDWRTNVLIDDETIRGRSAVKTYWERILSTFPFVHEDHRVSAVGDRVCIVAKLRAKGAASGIELTQPCGYALTLRDGFITRLDFFRDPQEALEAVGLEE